MSDDKPDAKRLPALGETVVFRDAWGVDRVADVLRTAETKRPEESVVPGDRHELQDEEVHLFVKLAFAQNPVQIVYQVPRNEGKGPATPGTWRFA